jgi:hypothetical protein
LSIQLEIQEAIQLVIILSCTDAAEDQSKEHCDPKESTNDPAEESVDIAGIGNEWVSGVLPPVGPDYEQPIV